MRIRLSAEDRERLGAPEWLDITASRERLMLRDVREIYEVTGLKPEDLAENLDKDNPNALAAVVWVALRRAGVRVALDDLDFDLYGLEVEGGSEGKDEAAAEPAETPQS